ncbi:hypothetical protein BAUCODRAFT_413800 [Baudoinia panamericana UAMH 10762]|uniref:Uncharacterized protein n=1 Tax=Baudoinia panamericana (strain UAMH 10762) TaxID=717646 RepID=M2MN59_BAUPA|nr:uncharacterized protein BAUCODRAFT_413800 [Baudoinia panamericana UAMH 10762]EMC98116.1 hypothetical protein BAUCODRAFT_413800 [Baudoinia panamericana UAMH 10762]
MTVPAPASVAAFGLSPFVFSAAHTWLALMARKGNVLDYCLACVTAPTFYESGG